MQDFQTLVEIATGEIQVSLMALDGDDKLNFLYFLRDNLNKEIKRASYEKRILAKAKSL